MKDQGLRLTVPARAENLAVIRQAVAGLADAMGFGEAAISDLKTVVTEACMNAVLHAYDGEPGPLEVDAKPQPEALEIAVRDRGTGFQPRPADPDSPGLRLGLPLIAALSDGFEIRGARGKGTEVRMLLSLAHRDEDVDVASKVDEPAHGTVMSIAAGEYVQPVLARVISALAARADFSIDRLSDAVLLGDAVSAGDAADFCEGMVGIEILDGHGKLNVQIGPLSAGASDRILRGLEIPGGGSLKSLASEVSVKRGEAGQSAEDSEYLVLEIDREPG